MKTDEKLSIKIIRRVVCVSIILISLFTIGVMASRSEINYVDIIFPDNTTITVMTSSVSVSDILSENHILVLPDEEVYPKETSNIDSSKKITISKITEEKVVVSEEVSNVSTEEILGKYVKITEKIITEQVEIPYETVTKDVSTVGTETTDKVLQKGKNGLKEIKYKVRYQDEQEIERAVVSETVIKEPVDKIIQISTRIISRSGSRANGSSSSIAASVEGRTPTVVTLNASAYTASTCGKSPNSPGYGRTASGAMATSWYTVAAGKGVPMGTVIYIPSFADRPNGGWFVVQDRGGAISNNRIDIYMDTLSECKQFGRRNIECHIYY
jgi:3D (Asp-Asp-Asp) domain-containing protein